MRELRFTLVADGSSDVALMPILVWLLREHFGRIPNQPEFADLGRLQGPPQKLSERIAKGVELYPCDLIFVHRDAERESIEKRVSEIREALEQCAIDTPPAICVVPVRMQEAWLLIDESALSMAAGNPQGRQRLRVPDTKKLEELPDPKQILHDLLCLASGLRGRRRKRFKRDLGRLVHRVAEHVDDFSLLRELTVFQKSQINQIIDALRANGRKIYVWLKGKDGWGEAKEVNLLRIFEAIGPYMIDEASDQKIAGALALSFGKSLSYRRQWPVPSNFVTAYIADMVSLDLVTTSSKRHGVKDTAAYWTLTDFGKEVFSRIRNNELLKGMAVFEESPEDEKGVDTEG